MITTPTPADRMPPLFSPEELENLDKYNNFMNEFSSRAEGGWLPSDRLPYDEDLLRHTLGLTPREKSNVEFYPKLDRVPKRSQITQESISGKESNEALIIARPINKEHLSKT